LVNDWSGWPLIVVAAAVALTLSICIGAYGV
jgi:hypothetical protein